MPGAGVDEDQVGGSFELERLTLPRTRMSFMPGTAVDTTSSAPDRTSRFEIRRNPWFSR